MIFVEVVALALGFPLLAVGIGWALLARFEGLDAVERFTASWGVGFAALALVQFLAFLTAAPQPLCHLTVLVLFAVGALLGWRQRSPFRSGSDFWSAAGLWTLGYLHLLAIQALLPWYVGGGWIGDWRMHYEVGSLIFAGRVDVERTWAGLGTYTLASRTPLFNLAAAFPVTLLGPHFWVFQVAATALSCCCFSALALVLRDLAGPRAARLALVLAPLNVWLLHESWFTWPKMLAAYFLLLSLHFYLRSLQARPTDPAAAARWFHGSGVAALLGYLTHQVAVVYLGVLLLHTLLLSWRQRVYRPRLRELALLALSAVVLLSPWYAWLLVRFGRQGVLHSTPVTQMGGQGSLLVSMAWNLFASVFPETLALKLWKGPRTFEEIYPAVTEMYFCALLGALTLSLSLFLLAALVCRLAGSGLRGLLAPLRQPKWTAAWTFALLGALGASALHPIRTPNGIAHAALFPSTVLLVGLAWVVLAAAPRPWRLLVGCGIVLEFAVLFWSHVWLTVHQPDLLDDLGWNVFLKEQGVRGLPGADGSSPWYPVIFLHDVLAEVQPAVVLATLAVQGILIVLLWRSLWRNPPVA